MLKFSTPLILLLAVIVLLTSIDAFTIGRDINRIARKPINILMAWKGDRPPLPNMEFLEQRMDATWGRGKFRDEVKIWLHVQAGIGLCIVFTSYSFLIVQRFGTTTPTPSTVGGQLILLQKNKLKRQHRGMISQILRPTSRLKMHCQNNLKSKRTWIGAFVIILNHRLHH